MIEYSYDEKSDRLNQCRCAPCVGIVNFILVVYRMYFHIMLAISSFFWLRN